MSYSIEIDALCQCFAVALSKPYWNAELVEALKKIQDGLIQIKNKAVSSSASASSPTPSPTAIHTTTSSAAPSHIPYGPTSSLNASIASSPTSATPATHSRSPPTPPTVLSTPSSTPSPAPRTTPAASPTSAARAAKKPHTGEKLELVHPLGFVEHFYQQMEAVNTHILQLHERLSETISRMDRMESSMSAYLSQIRAEVRKLTSAAAEASQPPQEAVVRSASTSAVAIENAVDGDGNAAAEPQRDSNHSDYAALSSAAPIASTEQNISSDSVPPLLQEESRGDSEATDDEGKAGRKSLKRRAAAISGADESADGKDVAMAPVEELNGADEQAGAPAYSIE